MHQYFEELEICREAQTKDDIIEQLRASVAALEARTGAPLLDGNGAKDEIIKELRDTVAALLDKQEDLYATIDEQKATIEEQKETIEDLRRGLRDDYESVTERVAGISTPTARRTTLREPPSAGTAAKAWVSQELERLKAAEDGKMLFTHLPFTSPTSSGGMEASLKAYRAHLSKLNYTNLKKRLIADGASKEDADRCVDTKALYAFLDTFQPSITNVTWTE